MSVEAGVKTPARTVKLVLQQSGAAARERYDPRTTGGTTPMAQFRQDTPCPRRSRGAR